MDNIEKFYICNETRLNNQINDKDTIKFNAIFDIISSQNIPQSAPWSSPRTLVKAIVSHSPYVHLNTHNTVPAKYVSTKRSRYLNILSNRVPWNQCSFQATIPSHKIYYKFNTEKQQDTSSTKYPHNN
jgi:hypothetical protein